MLCSNCAHLPDELFVYLFDTWWIPTHPSLPNSSIAVSCDIFSAPPELTTHSSQQDHRALVTPRNYVWLACVHLGPAQPCTELRLAHKNYPYIFEVSTFTCWINLYLIFVSWYQLTSPHSSSAPCLLSPSLGHTVYQCCQIYFAFHLSWSLPLLTENPFHHDAGELLPQAALTGQIWSTNMVLEPIFIWFSSFLGFTKRFMGQGSYWKNRGLTWNQES